MTHLDNELKSLMLGVRDYQRQVSDILRDKVIEIISDFNDQPHGRSKPSLKGKRYKVKSAHIDASQDGEIHLFCDGLFCLPALWRDAIIVSDRSLTKV